mmetsp:Transcript_4384/g.5527  ORF Transcript_4384/g.5527 Transcript_4384/m.5527 type:complete len:136 (+) Transcript_4384:274-681(+)
MTEEHHPPHGIMRKLSEVGEELLEKAVTKRMFFRCDLTEQQDINYVYKYTHRGSWRRKWIKILNTRRFQLFLGALLILDVIVLMTQIFLDAHFPPCFAVENSAVCSFTDAFGNHTEDSEALECTSEDVKAFFLCS